MDVLGAAHDVLVIGQYIEGLSRRNTNKVRKNKKGSRSLGSDADEEYANHPSVRKMCQFSVSEEDVDHPSVRKMWIIHQRERCANSPTFWIT